MAKPRTIRIPEDLLQEINQVVQELKMDRSAYLREIVSKGFSIDKEDRLLQKYIKGELSNMEVGGSLRSTSVYSKRKLKTRLRFLGYKPHLLPFSSSTLWD